MQAKEFKSVGWIEYLNMNAIERIQYKAQKKIYELRRRGERVSNHEILAGVWRVFKSLIVVVTLLGIALSIYLGVTHTFINPTHLSFMDILKKTWTTFWDTGYINGPTIGGSALATFIIYQIFTRGDRRAVIAYNSKENNSNENHKENVN